jgi:hypothetical protein
MKIVKILSKTHFSNFESINPVHDNEGSIRYFPKISNFPKFSIFEVFSKFCDI